MTDILFSGASIWETNEITELPIEVLVDGYTVEININGKVTLKQAKPQVTHTTNQP